MRQFHYRLAIILATVLAVTSSIVVYASLRDREVSPEISPEISAVQEPKVAALEGPLIVAIQPGHWKIDELPPEHQRRERTIGAVHEGIRELDINIAVVEALVPLLEAENWQVEVIPATVPPGLRADVFLSIHADWAADPERRGWKLSPPWRPSVASTSLSDALRRSFRAEENLPEDVGGITVGMRGYFGFSYYRYRHASSPYTPATLIELGFVTNETDRDLMVEDPGYYAGIIHRGLVDHFSTWDRNDVQSLIPQVFRSLVVGAEGAHIRATPDTSSGVVATLNPGQVVRPVDRIDGWYEVRLRNPFRIGWVAYEDLVH